MKTQKKLHARYITTIVLLLSIYLLNKCSEPDIQFYDVNKKIELKVYRKDGGMTTAHFEDIMIYYKGNKIYEQTLRNEYIEGVQLNKNNVIVLNNYMEQMILKINIDSLLKEKSIKVEENTK